MIIRDIEINNFRGINIRITNLKKQVLVMGRNDSGKSNLCYAIRKVLDPSVRRIPLLISDSTNHNKDKIEIKIKLLLENLNSIKRTIIGKYIDSEEKGDVIYIQLEAVYNHDLMFYEERLTIGNKDKKNIATNITNDVDKLLDIIYIEPNYNYEKSYNNYFSYKKKQNEKSEIVIGPAVVESAKNMNEIISKEKIVCDMIEELNSNKSFQRVFEDMNFEIKSSIEIQNIYKSLEISFLDYEGNSVGSIGDGKIKTLSMLLKKSSYESDKEKIIIIEEPENHMYPLLQKIYSHLIDELNLGQSIYTTHSPYIFDFKKMKQIIKLNRVNNKTHYNNVNIDNNIFEKFGYMLNEEIGEMLFYDKVLLVEGVSEKYFYNTLFNNDDEFKCFVQDNKMGIFCVRGIDFNPIKKFLNELGIGVLIKTDNDIFKVPKKELKRYAGIERVLNCLDEAGKEQLKLILSETTIDESTFRFESDKDTKPLIENNMMKIQELFIKYGVYLSVHNEGFEKDFLEFVGEDKIDDADLSYIKKAKMKNFHRYVMDEKIEIKITAKNKDSILIKFMYE